MLTDYLLLLIASIGIGLAGSLIGLGGGSLIVPLLIFYFNFSSHDAVGTSILIVVFTAISSTFAYFLQGRIDFKSGVILGLGTVPGGAFGAYLTRFIGGELLKAIFGIFLILVAIKFVISFKGRSSQGYRKIRYGLKRRIVDSKGEIFEYDLDILVGVFGSFVAGIVSGFLGIGGGTVMVPVLRFLAGMPMHLAVSVSLLIMCLTSTAGASMHFFLGHVVLGYAVYMACGVILGAQIGARLQIRTKPKVLQLIFGVALLLIGIRMGLSPFI